MLIRRLFSAALLLLPAGLPAQDDPFNEPEPVKASLVAEQSAIVPGKTFTVALRLQHDEHWHTYWRNSGDLGNPTKITWKLPEGFTAADAVWPIPSVVRNDAGVQHLFEGTVHILTDITAPASLKAGESVNLEASVSWLQCQTDGQCQPRKVPLKLTLPVAGAAERAATAAEFDAVRSVQPKETPAWKVTVGKKDANWLIRAEPGEGAAADPGTVYFFDAASAISYDEQKWTKDGSALVLEISNRAKDPALVPWGYLQASNSWLATGKVTLIPAGAAPGAAASTPATRETPAATESAVPQGSVSEAIKTIRGWGVRNLDGSQSESLSWPLALIFAFIGGMILNLMPCVFPVLGIKILGFVRQSGDDHGAVKKHGLVYAIGVILSVLLLAGVLLAVRYFGEQVGWGFQLQNPLFLLFLITLLFVMSLNLAGVFEVGTSLTGVGGELQSASGYRGSLFSGLLTVLVATPCTGPFMGPALGFALSADTPAILVLAVFIMLGVGLALPYVFLSYHPAFIKKLPKPGPWMETFKQLMAFPMFATCAWLLTVFASSTGADGLSYMIFALVLFAMALWFYGRFWTPTARARSKHIAAVCAVIAAAGGGVLAWRGAHKVAPAEVLEGHETAFSPQTIVERRAKGLTTVVDFGAKWCLQCETNRGLAFSRKEFHDSLPKYDAIFMYADWTHDDPVIEEFLTAYKQGGIPFALVIPPTGPAIQLPTVIPGPATLIEGLEESKKQSGK